MFCKMKIDVAKLHKKLKDTFPTLDIDAVLKDFPDIPYDHLVIILNQIPPYLNTYRIAPVPSAPPPEPQKPDRVAASEAPSVVDLTTELCEDLVRRLREDLATNKVSQLKSYEKHLKDTFPTLKPEFFTHCFAFVENRRVSAFILAFLAFNNLTDRLEGIVPYNHELFKHLEHSSSKIPPTAFDKIVKADFPKINEVLEVLLCNYDSIVDLQTLALRNQFTCAICQERYTDNVAICCGLETDLLTNGTVVHKFCPNCIQNHTNLNAEEMPLLEGGAGLKCIEHTCQRPIYISNIRSLLSKHVINRLDDRIQAESLAALGIHIERCDACGYAVELEKASETNKVFACPKCNKAKCRICKLDWDNEHFGVKCQELFEKLKKEKKDKYMNGVYARMNEAVFRKCHKCKVQFVKKSGCNWMKCRCGATQCYMCRATDIDHYDHYCAHPHDPALGRCTKCTKCSLWADAAAADKAAVEKLAKEAAKQKF